MQWPLHFCRINASQSLVPSMAGIPAGIPTFLPAAWCRFGSCPGCLQCKFSCQSLRPVRVHYAYDLSNVGYDTVDYQNSQKDQFDMQSPCICVSNKLHTCHAMLDAFGPCWSSRNCKNQFHEHVLPDKTVNRRLSARLRIGPAIQCHAAGCMMSCQCCSTRYRCRLRMHQDAS